MSEPFNYDDVSSYVLDAADELALVEAQNECTFMWSTKEGWPVGVVMSYVYHDDCFWLSVSSLRVRVKAVLRDPRVALSITSKGSTIKSSLSLTYKGRCEVLDDSDTIDWFLPALASRLRPGRPKEHAEFVRLNNTANRRVLKVTPEKTIGFDGRKMVAATQQARDVGTTDTSG
jgi:nitroimidazol reductase NimA-like FMN-containing flavoprotein (pyridoxamine 5'-phosphate oxidase superfamily)